MTLEEARKVAAIIVTADGGCGTCVESLTELMDEAFPEYTWEFDEKKLEVIVKPSDGV